MSKYKGLTKGFYTTEQVAQRRAGILKHRYKMTVEEYDEILESQGGVCAICKKPPEFIRLAVDHDQKCCPGRRSCGKCVRGIVCQRCNAVLGYIESNGILGAIRKYLKL